jgi:hypothetical protein
LLRDGELADIDEELSSGVTAHSVFVGGAQFSVHPYLTEVCFSSSGDPNSHRRTNRDPTWIVEALTFADHADHRASHELGVDVCEVFGFHVDLERHRAELDPPPSPGTLGAPHLLGEVWIDPQERVRRVTRSTIPRHRRRRWPSGAGPVSPSPATQITTDFWNYGSAVSIDTPVVKQTDIKSREIVSSFLSALWRRRREYRRRNQTNTDQPASGPDAN